MHERGRGEEGGKEGRKIRVTVPRVGTNIRLQAVASLAASSHCHPTVTNFSLGIVVS